MDATGRRNSGDRSLTPTAAGPVTPTTDNKGNTGSTSPAAEVVQPVSPGATASAGQRSVASTRLMDRLPTRLDAETGATLTLNPLVDPPLHAALTGQAPEAPDSKASVRQSVGQTVVPTKWGAKEIDALVKGLGIAKFSERQVVLSRAALPGIKANAEKLFSPSLETGGLNVGLLREGLRKACDSTYSIENYNYVQAVAAYRAAPREAIALKDHPRKAIVAAIQRKFITTGALNIQDEHKRKLATAVTQALATGVFPDELFDTSRDQVYRLIHSQQNVQDTFAGIQKALEQRGRETKGKG